MTTVYPSDYNERMRDYNKQVLELDREREMFYADNPDFFSKVMYMDVIAPPQKLIISVS